MLQMTSLPEHDVLTPDEVGNFLRVSEDAVRAEIASGRLAAIDVGTDLRILRSDLIEFLELARRRQAPDPAVDHPIAVRPPVTAPAGSGLEPGAPFSYVWPSGQREGFGDVYEGTTQAGDGVRAVRIGFTDRKAAGRVRKRAVVFIDKRPLVEFVAADDFTNTAEMLSLLKHRNGKQVRPGDRVPPDYKGFVIVPYNSRITGPYASSNLALVCSATDLNTMVKHALLRHKTTSGGKRV